MRVEGGEGAGSGMGNGPNPKAGTLILADGTLIFRRAVAWGVAKGATSALIGPTGAERVRGEEIGPWMEAMGEEEVWGPRGARPPRPRCEVALGEDGAGPPEADPEAQGAAGRWRPAGRGPEPGRVHGGDAAGPVGSNDLG